MASPTGTDGVAIKDTLVFLFAAGVLVPLLRFIKLPAIMGFVLAGIVLGPSGLGALAENVGWLTYLTISEPEAAAPFAELGVLFLLFLLGMELSFQKLWALRRIVFGAGALQSGASAAVVAGACLMIGLVAPASVAIGLALALSSTAIVMQWLIDEKRAASATGRTALGVLLFQDILVAPILILVGFMGQQAGANLGELVLGALVQGIIAIAVIVLIGRFLLSRLFRMAARKGGRDILLALCFFTAVGASVITATAGLSLALGAFLAGLLLGETEFKHQAEVDLEPFKGLLLGIFFMTVGMGLDLGFVADNFLLVIGGLMAMLLVKFVIAFGACWIGTRDRETALRSALLLAPAGEFAFVIMGAAVAGGVVTSGQASIVGAIAGASMLLTPLMGQLGDLLAPRLTSPGDNPHELPDGLELEGHVVIAGYGRVGQTIARVLQREACTIVAIDRDARRVAEHRLKGEDIYFGDVSRPEMLHRVNADRASLLVVTVDDTASAEAMTRALRAVNREAPILVRARDLDHADLLRQAGATFVIPEAIEAALQLAGRALEEFGYDQSALRDRLDQERDDAYDRSALHAD